MTVAALSSLGQRAQQYARRGWPVLPLHACNGKCSCGKMDCHSPGKHPIYDLAPNGLKNATTDAAIIDGWWKRYPNANIGIRTGLISKLLVLDVDMKNQHNGMASLATLGPLPQTRTIKTPTGGQHLYFTITRPFKCKAGIKEGLDIKADEGYVVAAPSVINGSPYAVTAQPGTIAPLPPSVERLLQQPEPRPALAASSTSAPIPQGKRNDALTRIGGSLRRMGLEEDAISAALMATNKKRCDPPLDFGEVNDIARNLCRLYEPAFDILAPVNGNGNGHAAVPVVAAPKLKAEPEPPKPGTVEAEEDAGGFSDMANAERFVRMHGEDLKYVFPFDKFYVWDRSRFKEDTDGDVLRKAKDTVLALHKEAMEAKSDSQRRDLAKAALVLENERKLRAMISMARPEIAISPTKFDVDPFLFNVRNGTIDLRTGQLRPHSRADLQTKLADVVFDLNAACPLWDRFLNKIFASSYSMIKFVQKAVGYSLTGDTRQQCLFILYGIGENGKSTLVETVGHIMGQYWKATPTSTFLLKFGDNASNDLAALHGVRYVSAVETDRGRRLNEPLIKATTGGDKVSARFLYSEYFEFYPAFKLWLAVNHKPQIKNTDHGLWRRIRLVPFQVQIPEVERDEGLKDKLKAEASGILAWAVQGCLLWQKEGLKPPEEVTNATAEYREASDVLGEFIRNKCVLGTDQRVLHKKLYGEYKLWSEMNNDDPLKKSEFRDLLEQRPGLVCRPGADNANTWRGIGLKDENVN